MSQKALGKIEEDVPAFYKRLRYPFQISKSSLFAVGSPHTWPTLLASLVWVVELLLYSEKAVSGTLVVDKAISVAAQTYKRAITKCTLIRLYLQAKTEDSLEDERQKAESDFFGYVAESYRCFLAGDDAKCEQVDSKKAAEFDEKAEEIKAQTAKIEEVLLISAFLQIHCRGRLGIRSTYLCKRKSLRLVMVLLAGERKASEPDKRAA